MPLLLLITHPQLAGSLFQLRRPQLRSFPSSPTPAGRSKLRTMRKAGGIVFLMASLALAMAATAVLLLPPPAAAAAAAARPRPLGRSRRSRFLAAAPAAMAGGSCSAEQPCPETTDPYGYPNPLDCCRGVCVDTSTSVLNCGGCGYACGSWPWICCDGYCFNSQNDYENCGQCGTFCDGACNNGVCDYAA